MATEDEQCIALIEEYGETRVSVAMAAVQARIESDELPIIGQWITEFLETKAGSQYAKIASEPPEGPSKEVVRKILGGTVEMIYQRFNLRSMQKNVFVQNHCVEALSRRPDAERLVIGCSRVEGLPIRCRDASACLATWMLMSSPRCIQGRFKQGHRSAIKSGFFSDSITLEMTPITLWPQGQDAMELQLRAPRRRSFDPGGAAHLGHYQLPGPNSCRKTLTPAVREAHMLEGLFRTCLRSHTGHRLQADGIWLMVSDPNADGFGLENGQMSHHYADRIGPQRPLCFECHGEVDTRKSLEQAIKSPKHPQKEPLVFQCSSNVRTELAENEAPDPYADEFRCKKTRTETAKIRIFGSDITSHMPSAYMDAWLSTPAAVRGTEPRQRGP
ncbi:hypothetical protein B0H13DRAFT_2284323 [Mycena leptocephala]|nr:hypothetical protein B0H13DRAFT_2284323 [Mycena leptocephala]